MHKLIRRLYASAAIVGAALSPQVQASTVLDFEGDIGGLYLAGESFSQSGFTMTAGQDFGTVGLATDLGSVGPSGNASQFFFSSNDGFLALRSSTGSLFNLDGFSAAFVPLNPPPSPAPTTVLVAFAIGVVERPFGTYFDFGGSATSSFPFVTYDNPADFGRFNNLIAVQFYSCVLDTGICATPTLNNGQFALDNIRVTVVPEPTTLLLMTLGLLGLAVRCQRCRR